MLRGAISRGWTWCCIFGFIPYHPPNKLNFDIHAEKRPASRHKHLGDG